MSGLPPLPEGFSEIDESADDGLPPLPEGFSDAPEPDQAPDDDVGFLDRFTSGVKRFAQDKLDTLEGNVRGNVEGFSFGFAGDAMGKGAELADVGGRQRAAVRGVHGGNEPLLDGDEAARLDARTSYDQSLDAAREHSPIATYGGEVAGGALATAPLGGGLMAGAGKVVAPMAKSAPRAARLIQAGMAGAPVGALEAAGRSRAPVGSSGFSADVAMGAGVGAVAPAAVEGLVTGGRAVAGAAKRQAGRYVDKILGRADDEAAAVLGDLAGDAKTMAQVDVPRSGDFVPEGATARGRAERGASPKAVESHTRAIGEKLDELEGLHDGVTALQNIEAKRPVVLEMMETEGIDPDDVVDAADDTFEATLKAFEELADDVGTGNGKATVARMKREAFDQFPRRGLEEGEAAPHDVAVDRFMRLDQLKRELMNAVDVMKKDTEVRGRLTDMAEGLRGFLEDQQVWGHGASTLQKVRNIGWRNYLLMNSKDMNPERLFMTDATGKARGSGTNAYRLKLQHDRKGLHETVDQAGGFLGEPKVARLREWVNRKADLLDALTKHPGADDAEKAAAERARQLADDINLRLDQRTNEAEWAGKIVDIESGESGLPGPGGLQGWLQVKARGLPWVGKIAEARVPTRTDQIKRVSALERAGRGDELARKGKVQQLVERTRAMKDAPTKAPGAALDAQPAPVAKLAAGSAPRTAGAMQPAAAHAEEDRRHNLDRMVKRMQGGGKSASKGKAKGGDVVAELAGRVAEGAQQDIVAAAAAHYENSTRNAKYREAARYNQGKKP